MMTLKVSAPIRYIGGSLPKESRYDDDDDNDNAKNQLIKAKGLIGEGKLQGKLIQTKSNFHLVFGERAKPENVRGEKPFAAE